WRIDKVGPGIEEELVGPAVEVAAAAKGQIPQAGDGNRRPVRVPQRTEEGAGDRVEGVDVAGAFHVADQDVVAEPAEMRRGLDDAPGVLERTGPARVGGEVVWGQQVAVGVKNVDDAAVWRRVDGKSDPESAVYLLDLPGTIARVLHRDVRISEGA